MPRPKRNTHRKFDDKLYDCIQNIHLRGSVFGSRIDSHFKKNYRWDRRRGALLYLARNKIKQCIKSPQVRPISYIILQQKDKFKGKGKLRLYEAVQSLFHGVLRGDIQGATSTTPS